MKPNNQFFHLFKYLSTASWWIWMMPLTFAVQPAVSLLLGTGSSSLSVHALGLGMLCMMPMLLATMVFAPEIFCGMHYTTPQTQQMAAAYSNDFLLTRPVDKPVVFSARYAFYFCALSLPLVILFSLAFIKPSLKMEVPAKSIETVTFYSSHLPDAMVTQKSEYRVTIHSPNGRVYLVLSMIVTSLAFISLWPPFVIWLSRRRFQKWIFWTVLMGGLLGMQMLPLFLWGRFLEKGLFLIQSHLLVSCVMVGVLAFLGFRAALRGMLDVSR
jgi:hypothetical protein